LALPTFAPAAPGAEPPFDAEDRLLLFERNAP
jgi:hypothetical protein